MHELPQQQDVYDSDDSLTKLNLLSAASGSGKRGLPERKAGDNIDDSSLPPRKVVGKVFGKRGKSLVDKSKRFMMSIVECIRANDILYFLRNRFALHFPS